MTPQALSLGDAARLSLLEAESFDHPWRTAEIAAELAKPGTLALGLFGESGALDASVLFSTVLDEAELLRVATRPAVRRKGYGRTLLEAGLERLRRAGIAAVFLEVDEGNLPARELYRQLGFAEIGRRPAYYRDGAAAVLYRRGL